MSKTLYDKIWDDHLVYTQDDGTSLLYVDRHLVHEVTSPQAFEGLRNSNRKVRRAKLYYLRDRTGKSARIAEKIRKKIGIDVETKPETVNEENVVVSKEEKIAEKETSSTETAKKVEKKTETPKAESPKENLKDKK